MSIALRFKEANVRSISSASKVPKASISSPHFVSNKIMWLLKHMAVIKQVTQMGFPHPKSTSYIVPPTSYETQEPQKHHIHLLFASLLQNSLNAFLILATTSCNNSTSFSTITTSKPQLRFPTALSGTSCRSIDLRFPSKFSSFNCTFQHKSAYQFHLRWAFVDAMLQHGIYI